MDPWTAIAKAVVYPLAKAIADAWFDARAKYDRGVDEAPNDSDRANADRMRSLAQQLQPIPTDDRDFRPHDSSPHSGGN